MEGKRIVTMFDYYEKREHSLLVLEYLQVSIVMYMLFLMRWKERIGIRAGRRTLFKSGLFSVWSYRREVQKVNRRIFLFSIAIVDPLLPNLMIKRPGLLSRWWRLWSSSTTRTSSISTSSPRTWCWSIWALLTSFCKSIFYSIYFIFHSTYISFYTGWPPRRVLPQVDRLWSR